MKRYFIFMAIILGMIVPSISAQTAKQKVAVYVTGDAESGYKKVIGSKLVTGITRSEGYTAVERTTDFLAALSSEQDYQMSGAVSDNQIARLGRQFGVRYVLVADISEVFESMFISARMIDVQTARIINSAESEAVVDNMESLTKIADKIVFRLFCVKEYAKDEIKVLGPFSTVKDLYECNVPKNYHIATQDEMERIIESYRLFNKKISFPIYADIISSNIDHTEYYRVYMREDNYFLGNFQHLYSEITLSCVFITNSTSYSAKTLSFVDDPSYRDISSSTLNRSEGVKNYAQNPSITPGYIYLIKTEGEDE